MDYYGTSADDKIDQQALGLPAGTVIFAREGDDVLFIANANALGEAGNDLIRGSTPGSTAVYWTSPRGVNINLATGIVLDGYGTRDTLVNIHSVQGSFYNDHFTGSAGDDSFHGAGGSDVYLGGGGKDTVSYFFVQSSEAAISYDVASDTFTVKKNFVNDKGTDVLTGINSIRFVGAGSDEATLTRDQFAPINGFLRFMSDVATPIPGTAFASQIKAGDFNGDGHVDFTISTAIGTGTGEATNLFYLNDGNGNFADGTAKVADTGALSTTGAGRTVVADFNQDGVSDLFLFNQGNDVPPFLGGLNGYYLSSTTTGRLQDQSATLGQGSAFNHAGSVGDVNNDGYVDLLVNMLLDGGNQLYLNDGTGHLQLRADMMPHPRNDANGQPLTNTASGVFDVNGDGYADLVLGDWNNEDTPPSSQILLNDGTGNFSHSSPIALPSSGVKDEVVLDIKPIDVNGDGLTDMMLSVSTGTAGPDYYSVAHIQLLINKGDGVFADETLVRLGPGIQQAAGIGWFMQLTAADIDHDGYIDIFASGAGGNVSSLLLHNRGDGTFLPGWTSSQGERSVLGDVDNDGMLDIISNAQGRTYIFLNKLNNGHVYAADHENAQVSGSSGNDSVSGTAANNRLQGNGGDDRIDGGGGRDSVSYAGSYKDFSIEAGASGFVVTDLLGTEGEDTLLNVERLVFADTSVALDIDGVGGQAYRIYRAAFDRAPDLGGVGYWMSVMDSGATLKQIAAGFVASNEFKLLYGDHPGNADILNRFYVNALHRAPDKAGYNYWLDILNTNSATTAEVLASFSESTENQAALIGVIGNGFEYTRFG